MSRGAGEVRNSSQFLKREMFSGDPGKAQSRVAFELRLESRDLEVMGAKNCSWCK